jgi:hypothetical protein
LAELLDYYGVPQYGGTQFIFVVGKKTQQRHEQRHEPNHVYKSLLSYLIDNGSRGKFDAILLMGCNSINWVLKGDFKHGVFPVYSPAEARGILHAALKPGGLLLVFENARTGAERVNPVNKQMRSDVVVQNLETLSLYRRLRSPGMVIVNGPNAIDKIRAVFAQPEFAKLAPGVFKKLEVPVARGA